MIIETEEKDVRHPEGKILLKNGNVLDCCVKEDRPVVIEPDNESWEELLLKDKGEVTALTYFIAGSPLSGSNRCSVVDRKGKSWTHIFRSPFSDLWSTFMKVNGRYTEAKQRYQAYTLTETVARLRGER